MSKKNKKSNNHFHECNVSEGELPMISIAEREGTVEYVTKERMITVKGHTLAQCIDGYILLKGEKFGREKNKSKVERY